MTLLDHTKSTRHLMYILNEFAISKTSFSFISIYVILNIYQLKVKVGLIKKYEFIRGIKIYMSSHKDHITPPIVYDYEWPQNYDRLFRACLVDQ